MFEAALEKMAQFTRPVHSITRNYAGLISPGSATLFFVNNKGVAITCKHVANFILGAENINQGYLRFRDERARLQKDGKYAQHLKGLELKYKYHPEATVQLKHKFLHCFDRLEEITCHQHETLDLAILEFKGFNQLYYSSHASFLKDSTSIKQGKYLCRVGFPFPEFNNFQYNKETDDIEWTSSGNQYSPSFPIDGIVTRFLGDPQKGTVGIEMSTPGLRGQSGGPLFDTEGRIYGMQFATNHLHLGFDIKDREILQDGKKNRVSNYPFLHVGLCVHVDQIKAFLRRHGIDFHEAD